MTLLYSLLKVHNLHMNAHFAMILIIVTRLQSEVTYMADDGA